MTRPTATIAYPPRIMRAATAAAYVDEISTDAFLRRVGTVYPDPIHIAGRGRVWLREDLDRAIAQLENRGKLQESLADVL